MPANKISHNNGMAQLPLAISGKPFTTMKKALFHGRLRVFGEKMNTSVCLYGVFTSQPQDLVVVDKDFHHITQEMLGFFGGANCYQPQSMTKNIK